MAADTANDGNAINAPSEMCSTARAKVSIFKAESPTVMTVKPGESGIALFLLGYHGLCWLRPLGDRPRTSVAKQGGDR